MGFSNNSVTRWLRHNISDPLIVIIQRGADPQALALSGAVGITLGIFPIYGVTAVMCACAIYLLGSRCNAPTMMLANVISTPLEISLVVPFLRLGEFVTHGRHLLLSKDSLWKALTGRASWEVIGGIYHAFLGWIIAAPFIAVGLYIILLPLMSCSVRRYGSERNEGELAPLMKDPIVCPVPPV